MLDRNVCGKNPVTLIVTHVIIANDVNGVIQ
jgi:hypothetical protein